MNRTMAVELARGVVVHSVTSGTPISHGTMRVLAFLAGGDWALVDHAVFDAFAEIRVEQQRAAPAFWEA